MVQELQGKQAGSLSIARCTGQEVCNLIDELENIRYSYCKTVYVWGYVHLL